MNQCVVEIENASDLRGQEPALEEVTRHAHNLKGAAAAVGMQPVREVAHRLETIFTRMGDRGRPPDAAVFDAIHQGLDAIAALVAAAQRGDAPLDVPPLVTRLDEVAAGG
ncbi:MAG: Hpt domain-containing protein [Actinomycetota bacterium]